MDVEATPTPSLDMHRHTPDVVKAYHGKGGDISLRKPRGSGRMLQRGMSRARVQRASRRKRR